MKKHEKTSGTYAHVRRLPRDATKKGSLASSAYSGSESRSGSNRQKIRAGGIYLSSPKLSGDCSQGQATTKIPGSRSSSGGYPRTGGSAGRNLVSVLGLLGLARKAGKLVIGEQAVRKSLQLSQVHLLVLATDSSTRTKLGFATYADASNITILEIGTKTELGSKLGRNLVAVAAINDPSLAQEIIRKWESVEN